MRPLLAILLVLAPLSAQVARPVSAHAHVAAALQTAPPRVSLASLAGLARGFDRDLRGFAMADPIDVLGNTRGIYLDGFGAVFTTELSPILTPQLNPFRPNISEQDKAAVRQRKLARIPAVERLMNSMLQTAARELAAPKTHRVFAHAEGFRNARAGPSRQRQQYRPRPISLAPVA